MNQTSCRVLLVAAYLCIGMSRAAPGHQLDQSNVYSSASFDAAVWQGGQRAQTFTVGRTGLLTGIDLQILRSPEATHDFTLSLRTTTGGIPNSNDASTLFESIIPMSIVPGYPPGPQSVPLTHLSVTPPIAVKAGDVLALSLSRDGRGSPPWGLWRHGTAKYTGGTIYHRPSSSDSWILATGYDAGFRTYVTIPEPATLVLFALAIVAATFVLR
jgi:hypothetical protein